MLDSKKPNKNSYTQVEDALFYSNDTDASLVFIPHEDSFEFQSAKVVMYNRSDESLVERDAVVTTENGRKVASYELPEEIILHWGEWVAQPVFISGGEIYSGSIVPFSVIRYLMDNRPPTLRDIIKIDELYSQLVAIMDEISDKDVISAPEIILARRGYESLSESLNNLEFNMVTGKLPKEKIDDEVIVGLEDTTVLSAQNSATIGVSILQFPRLEGETDDLPRFQRAIDFLSSQSSGGRLVIPNTGSPYLVQFREGSTINNPTRVEITSDNIEIIGVGLPLIEMKGLTKGYLDSIDDYASSGRDIFSVFSFTGCANPRVEGIEFTGEFDRNSIFRYQSPRAIAVAFKGTKNAVAKNLIGSNILGNVVNAVNSYIDFDAPYAEATGTTISDCKAYDCLENGFNIMGGTRDSFVSNLYAEGCANGIESASNGLVVTNCIFSGNRGSAIGLSGRNTILNNVIGDDSVGEEGKNNGYGLIMTGGGEVQVNGGSFTGNTSYGFIAYPGVNDVQFNNTKLENDGNGSAFKTTIYIVGAASKMIKDVSFTNCKLNSTDDIFLGIMNFAENISFINCQGNAGGNSSLIFNSNCFGSKVIGNRFNKAISMSDTTGEDYNNGLYKIVDKTTIPTTGTWVLGDIINNRQPTRGGVSEWRCIQAGTFGVLNGGSTTGNIEADSKTLTVNNATGLHPGVWITIAGISGVRRAVSVTGTTIELDIVADTTVTDAAVSYRAPVIIPSRQNGVMTTVSSTPAFTGQTAVVGGSAYIATGTSSPADWKAITA